MLKLYVKNVFLIFYINAFNYLEIVKKQLRTSQKQFWMYHSNIKETFSWNLKITIQLLVPLKESLS
jgi:hypothetical protein